MSIPKNWPPTVTYLTKPHYSSRLPSDALSSLKLPSTSSHDSRDYCVLPPQAGPSRIAKICPIQKFQHPARGEFGLFATTNLKPSTLIIFYLGYVHGPEETDQNSSYDLSFDRETGIGIDATNMGNEARFINDYRGVSDAPNSEFRDCWISTDGGLSSEKGIAVYVLSAGKSGKAERSKGIRRGEEILVSYGKGFWKEKGTGAAGKVHTV